MVVSLYYHFLFPLVAQWFRASVVNNQILIISAFLLFGLTEGYSFESNLAGMDSKELYNKYKALNKLNASEKVAEHFLNYYKDNLVGKSDDDIL